MMMCVRQRDTRGDCRRTNGVHATQRRRRVVVHGGGGGGGGGRRARGEEGRERLRRLSAQSRGGVQALLHGLALHRLLERLVLALQ